MDEICFDNKWVLSLYLNTSVRKQMWNAAKNGEVSNLKVAQFLKKNATDIRIRISNRSEYLIELDLKWN